VRRLSVAFATGDRHTTLVGCGSNRKALTHRACSKISDSDGLPQHIETQAA
jgi:hypothetical protein